MYFHAFFVLFFWGRKYVRAYVFCIHVWLSCTYNSTKLLNTKRCHRAFYFKRNFLSWDTKGNTGRIREVCVIEYTSLKTKISHLWLANLIRWSGRGEIKEINLQGKKDALNDQRNEYSRQWWCSLQNHAMKSRLLKLSLYANLNTKSCCCQNFVF